jgi:hypothetical protein
LKKLPDEAGGNQAKNKLRIRNHAHIATTPALLMLLLSFKSSGTRKSHSMPQTLLSHPGS